MSYVSVAFIRKSRGKYVVWTILSCTKPIYWAVNECRKLVGFVLKSWHIFFCFKSTSTVFGKINGFVLQSLNCWNILQNLSIFDVFPIILNKDHRSYSMIDSNTIVTLLFTSALLDPILQWYEYLWTNMIRLTNFKYSLPSSNILRTIGIQKCANILFE